MGLLSHNSDAIISIITKQYHNHIITLFLLISLPWFIIINLGASSELFVNAVKKDMLFKLVSVQESHGAPPGTYFIFSILSAWPIFLFIIPTIIWSYKNKHNKAIIFLLSSILLPYSAWFSP